MRPDEHKKNKNAAYKKKHNIQTQKKSDSPEKRDSNSTERHSDDSRRRLPTDSTKQAVKQTRAEELPISKVYHRRKVESNWQKYEETVDTETEPDTRGAAYEDVLQATYNVKTEFQFHKFQSSNDDHGGELDSGVADMLTIDCKRLANSLRCVPLHTRLDIDESMFDKSELEAFSAVAKDRLSRYKPSEKSDVTYPHAGTAAVVGDTKVSGTLTAKTTYETEVSVTAGTGPDEINGDVRSTAMADEAKVSITCGDDTHSLLHASDAAVNKAGCDEPSASLSAAAAVDYSHSQPVELTSSSSDSPVTATSQSSAKTLSQLELELDSLLSM